MNKFAKVICMMAVVALAFTSCKKNNENEKSFGFNNTKTEQLTEIYDEDGGEKAYIDGNNCLQFEDLDELMLFNYCPGQGKKHLYNRYKYNEQGDGWWREETPYMSGIDSLDDGGYFYAFYPAENVVYQTTSLNDNHARVTFRVNPTQDYRPVGNQLFVPKDAMYMAAKSDGGATHNMAGMYLDFKNICGILSLKFYSPSGKKVTSIEVEDKRFNVVGDIACNIENIEVDPAVENSLRYWLDNYQDTESYNTAMYDYLRSADGIGYTIEGGSKKITLNCPAEGVELGKTKSKATRFLIVMRPLALLHGATITVHFAGEPAVTPVTIDTDRDNRIMPNVVRNMTAYNVG